MIRALFLATNIITKELKEYCHHKNVDPATLLSKRYHKFLDIFSKKKEDTFSIHCSI